MDNDSKDYFADFFLETERAFHYLVTDYKYNLLSKRIEEQNDTREKHLSVRYLSLKMSIEVSWFLSSASLDVYLIENLSENNFPSQMQFWGKSRDHARAISFYTYMTYLDKEDVLLLKKTRSVEGSEIAKRMKLINENLNGIIRPLAKVNL